jgi:hypothetical protein
MTARAIDLVKRSPAAWLDVLEPVGDWDYVEAGLVEAPRGLAYASRLEIPSPTLEFETYRPKPRALELERRRARTEARRRENLARSRAKKRAEREARRRELELEEQYATRYEAAKIAAVEATPAHRRARAAAMGVVLYGRRPGAMTPTSPARPVDPYSVATRVARALGA